MKPSTSVPAAAIELDHQPVPPGQCVRGEPTTAATAGDVVRLAGGAETVWTVTETLRKVYVTGG